MQYGDTESDLVTMVLMSISAEHTILSAITQTTFMPYADKKSPYLCPLRVSVRLINCLPVSMSICLTDSGKFRSVSVQISVKQAKQMLQKKVNLITRADSPLLAFLCPFCLPLCHIRVL